MRRRQAPGQCGPLALAVGIETNVTPVGVGTGSHHLDDLFLPVETTGDGPSPHPEGGPSVLFAAADESLRVAGISDIEYWLHD